MPGKQQGQRGCGLKSVALPLCRSLRKLDPEDDDGLFSSCEVQSEAKEENAHSSGSYRMSVDQSAFVESGRRFPRLPHMRGPSVGSVQTLA